MKPVQASIDTKYDSGATPAMCGWRSVRRICGITAATPNTDAA